MTSIMEYEYAEEINKMINEYTEDRSLYINKAALVERFVEIDEYFNHRPWNLMQILANINMIVEEVIPLAENSNSKGV